MLDGKLNKNSLKLLEDLGERPEFSGLLASVCRESKVWIEFIESEKPEE